MPKNKIIQVEGREIAIISQRQDDYISLTDIAKHKNEEVTGLVISHWLSTRYTVEFMGLWEQIHNPTFNVTEFSNIKSEAGSNGYVLSSKQWIAKTNAIGIISKTGRYGGGTFAHRDIAFEFASWISASFKLYLIKEFQRLKDEENNRLKLDWNLQRTISKINYRIHTDAIKESLVPKEITKEQANFIYANEADILNVALFGKTAKEWCEKKSRQRWKHQGFRNPGTVGCIEQYGEPACRQTGINALLIQQGLPQSQRLIHLNKTSITQMKSLLENKTIKNLK